MVAATFPVIAGLLFVASGLDVCEPDQGVSELGFEHSGQPIFPKVPPSLVCHHLWWSVQRSDSNLKFSVALLGCYRCELVGRIRCGQFLRPKVDLQPRRSRMSEIAYLQQLVVSVVV
jgi:hypothetical protein